MSRQPKTNRLRRFAAAARSLVGSGDGLDRCPDCGRAFVCPVEWDTAGEEHWLIALRCGECGHWREELVTNEQANAYDLALDRQYSTIVRALKRIDRERMEAELDVLVAALDRDLIDAAASHADARQAPARSRARLHRGLVARGRFAAPRAERRGPR